MARLKDIAEISAGQGAPQGDSNYCQDGIPFVKAANLPELIRGKPIGDIQKVSVEVAKKYKLKLFPKGTVLFAKSGMSCLKGYVYVLPTDAYVVNHLACISPCMDISDFLVYYFSFHKPNLLVKDAAYPSISLSDIRNIEIDLKSPETRANIVSTMDKLTHLISSRKQQLAKLDELVKARFVEMFGDPVHNTKMLPLKSLSDLGSLDRGRSKHRPRNAPELLGGPYPLIQTGEVTNSELYITSFQNTYSELGLQQSKMWNAGTLCITIAANIAQTAILAIDACFPDSVVGFVPHKEITAVYMHYWFGFFQKILEEQAPQVAQKNINLQILSDLKVMVPSMENQQEFFAFVEQVEKSKLTIRQSLDKMEVLKKSLMREYFG